MPDSAVAVATPRSVAVEPAGALDSLVIKDIHGRTDLERIETTVTVPADFQYAIPTWGKLPNGEWGTMPGKVGLTSAGYEYLNRVLGVSFHLPATVPDDEGNLVQNPIHRKDYIYLRMAAVWYNPIGQLVMATEDIEVDYALTYADTRLNAKGAEVILGADGQPERDANDNFKVKGLDSKAELKAAKALSQLRTFGLRYAQTVVRVRLLKMASGIRELPIDSPRPFPVKLTGFRDKMDPKARWEQATSNAELVYGRPAEVPTLSHEDLTSIQPDDVDAQTEALDQAILEREPTREPLVSQSHPDAEPPEA